MKAQFTGWWDKVSRAGLDTSVSEEDQKPIRVLNQVCAAGLLVLVFYVFLAIALQVQELLLLTFLGMLGFSSIIFLNYKKKFLAAKFYCIFLFLFFVCLTVFYTGLRGQAQFSFLVNASLPLVLFRNRKVIVSLFLLNVAFFFACFYLLKDYTPPLQLTDYFYEVAYHISFVSVTLLVFLIIFYFKKSNEEYQGQILLQKNEIENRNREVRESIEYASNIQRAILTPDHVFSGVFPDHFLLFKPKDIVSGDFYKACRIGEEQTLFFVADCTGHGVPGALMSMVGNSRFNEIVLQQQVHRPDEVLHALRQGIIELLGQDKAGSSQKDGMDMALCRYNKRTGILEYAGANNPAWLIRNTNGNPELVELRPDKQPVGLYHGELRPFSLQTLQAAPGTCVYLFSDGFADQFGGPKGKKFKYSRMKELLLGMHREPMPVQKKKLEQAFEEWKGNLEQIDDVCILGVRI